MRASEEQIELAPLGKNNDEQSKIQEKKPGIEGETGDGEQDLESRVQEEKLEVVESSKYSGIKEC